MTNKKYWEYWNDLQRLPTKDQLPANATYLRADRDEGYYVDEGEYEVWYGDGSNRTREWIENIIAIPAKYFGWRRGKIPPYVRNMYYSYANVCLELWCKPIVENGLKGWAITTEKPKKFVFHSRGVWLLAEAIRQAKMGITIEEVICMGIPHPGGRKLMDELADLGIKITIYYVEGDWVVNRPVFGKTFGVNYPIPEDSNISYIVLKNTKNLKGIKAIHLSYGFYLKQRNL